MKIHRWRMFHDQSLPSYQSHGRVWTGCWLHSTLFKKKQSYQSWSSTQLGGQQKLKPYISWNKRMQILSVDPHLPASPSRYPAKSLWPALSWIISLQWSKLTRNKLIWVWVTNGGRQWAHQNDHLEMQIVNHPLLSSIYDLAHTGPITIYSKYHIIYI